MIEDGPSLTSADGLLLATRRSLSRSPLAVVVLSHGFGEHSGRYARLAAVLHDARIALHSYDLRGHGRSAGQRGHTPSLDAYLDDLARVIDRACGEVPGLPLFLFGYSAGGNIALNYALRQPSGIHGVIAIAPWLRLAFSPPTWKTALGRVAMRVAPNMSFDFEADAPPASRNTRVIEDKQADPLMHNRMSAAAFTVLTEGGQALLDGAADFALPLLVMHGGDDQVISADAAAEFVAGVRHSDKRFVLFPGMAHEILNEPEPRAVHTEIVAWITHHLRAPA